ncbi:cellulose biosynthesis protein BcsC [Stutzerimonas azotifigens]|uniref:cellulose biosynthesis protein BcsC n=1 Tax=Stutzerimonas azotifigens TaxID=291995 RepID=UPI0004193CA5|nr:cellulose biosynthesis protein BcsC [Stutzerimonas azotifigens]
MAFRALTKLSLAICCAALAGTTLHAQAADAPANGIEVLLQQADFWQSRNRPQLVQETLQRALAVQPDAEEVLYRLALFAVPEDEQAARDWLQRLRRSHPDSPRIAAVEQALLSQGVDRARLAEIRLMASRGDTARAAEAYRSLLGSAPPPDLALEYYQTLAGQDASWEEARRGLEQLHQQRPDDLQVRLALARALSYRPATRRQAIAHLETLAPRLPEADQAWRQALIWLDPTKEDAALYERYAQAHPADDQVPARLEAALAKKKEKPGTGARLEAFAALERGRTAAAIASFRQALQQNPKDAEAWGGLGVAQLRAQNHAQAAQSLRKAIELAPGQKAKWSRALASAEFYGQLERARALRDAEQLEAAEAAARPLAEGDGVQARAARLLLGDILLRQQRAADAEQLYRQMLDAGQADAAVVAGLYGSLLRQGKHTQAQALRQRHPDLPGDALTDLQRLEALALRDRAEELADRGDTDGAVRSFGEALALAPQDPWVRLAYARFLDRHDDPQQARLLVKPLDQGPVDAETLHAAALLAVDQQRWDEAAAYLRRIPAAQAGSAEIRSLGARIDNQARIARARQAVAAGNPVLARQALRALYDEAPEDFAARGQIAQTLAELGEPALALAMVREDLRRNEPHPAADHLAHVAVLTRTGQIAEADALMRQLERRDDMTAADRQALQSLRSGFAVAQADNQRLAGDLAGAYDTLMAGLQAAPGDESLLLAMGRVYDSGKMHKEAGAVYDAVLERAPNNPDALTGAVRTALANDDPKRASQLISRAGTSLDEATALVLSARVAEAQGDNRRAIALLEMARRKQLGAGSAPPAQAIEAPPLLARANPFRSPAREPLTGAPLLLAGAASLQALPGDGGGSFFGAPARPAMADPLAGEIERTLDSLREKTATRLQGGTAVRVRDGEAGLSRLTEIEAPMQLSMVPLDNARLSFTATPVHLDAGTASDDAARRFGSHALASGATNSLFSYFAGQVRVDSESRLRIAEQQTQQNLGRPLTPSERANLVQASRTAVAQSIRDQAIAEGASSEAADRLYDSLLNSSAQRLLAPYKPGSQSDSGVAFNVGFESDSVQADIGTTPLGFERANAVGGFAWTPKVGANGTLKLGVERRAVTDSLLSYAGAKDPLSGKTWGGVTRTGVNVQYAYDNGETGFYVGNDAYLYRGKNVADNHSLGLHAGAYVRPIQDETRQLQAGVHFEWMGFDKNLSGHTLGHGGYFSPENYVGLSFPVEYSLKADRWNMKLRGALGYQSFTQDKAPYFPEDDDLQSALEGLEAASATLFQGTGLSGPTIDTHYRSSSDSGVAFNGGASLEYSLGKRTRLGGTIGYDSFGDYSETSGAIYLRHSMENLP